MNQELFRIPWSSALNTALQQLTRDLEPDTTRPPEPTLAERIEIIETQYFPTVTRIDKKRIKAKRRTIDVLAEDENGPLGSVCERVIEVNIPYDGDANSFRIAPTGGIQVYADCEIGANSLVLTVADDKYAHAKVRTFVGQMSSNLEALRDEIESLKPLVRIAMQRAAARKKQRIAIPNETDLDFPIED